LAHTLLGSVSLKPSGKLFESCPHGRILECRGIAIAVPITIDKIDVNLDFHIFDILDFDLLIGYPLENIHHSPLGSLHEKLGNLTFATPCLENPTAKLCPKQNLFEKMHEQPSSSSIEFKPFYSSPHCVVLDRDRDTTMIFHDEPLEVENSWDRESSEALTLEFKENNSIDEDGSFIVQTSPPWSFSTPPESGTHCTMNAFATCNLLKVLSSKTFERMVVDAFVYHKHCKFRGCTIAVTLQLKHNQLMVVKVGATSPIDSCRKKPPWSSL
jgi:hypothetical protein